MIYSVIGFYDESGQLFMEYIDAPNALIAIELCANERDTATFVCAVKGKLQEGADLEFAGDSVVYADDVARQ